MYGRPCHVCVGLGLGVLLRSDWRFYLKVVNEISLALSHYGIFLVLEGEFQDDLEFDAGLTSYGCELGRDEMLLLTFGFLLIRSHILSRWTLQGVEARHTWLSFVKAVSFFMDASWPCHIVGLSASAKTTSSKSPRHHPSLHIRLIHTPASLLTSTQISHALKKGRPEHTSST